MCQVGPQVWTGGREQQMTAKKTFQTSQICICGYLLFPPNVKKTVIVADK